MKLLEKLYLLSNVFVKKKDYNIETYLFYLLLDACSCENDFTRFLQPEYFSL
jgi:hypothetical protein